MRRVINGEGGTGSRSVNIKPKKIFHPFLSSVDEKLEIDNFSKAISILMEYFLRNMYKKKFIKELKEIKRDIDLRRIKNRPPGF